MVLLYEAEAELFRDIRHVEFGDLYDIEVLQEGEQVEMDLSPRDKVLLELLRDGINAFHSIGVHHGQPSYAVISGVSRSGNRFRRKIKIS
jgi:hypothetical protein